MIDFLLSPWTVGGFVGSLAVGGFALWWFFPSIAAGLITTKTGRTIIIVLAGIAGVMVVLARVFAEGRAKELAKQKEESLKNLRERAKTDDAIRSLPVDERKRRLQEWSRG